VTGVEVAAVALASYVLGALSMLFAVALCMSSSIEEDDRG
jgi:hypothetical protein